MATVKVACGYIIEQDVINELLADLDIPNDPEESDDLNSDSEGQEVTTVNPAVIKVDKRTICLTSGQRAGTPQIICLLRDASVGYDTCAIFVLMHFAYVSSHEEIQEKSCESESDRIAKRRSKEIFGRGIQDSHMKFATERHRTVNDLRRARR